MKNLDQPQVSVVIGFYSPKNEDYLINCITTLKEQTYKNFDIWIYDNSRLDGGLDKLRKLFPDINIKRNKKNLGFAGGNNSVIRELLKDNSIKYIALLNDDTKPDINWLTSLVNRSELNHKIGAVTSKLIFYEPFIRIEFKTQTQVDSKGNEIGIRFFEDSGIKQSTYKKMFYREGLYGFIDDGKGRFSYTKGNFIIDFPIGDQRSDSYELDLHLGFNPKVLNQSLLVKFNNSEFKYELTPGVTHLLINLNKDTVLKNSFNLIQNVGSGVTAQFQGYDIGNLQKAGDVSSSPEIDNGQYETSKNVEMFCGGAVLFNVSTLKDVGLFDEYFFTYYEDSDLSRRMFRAGWEIVYEPKAVVRHIHAGSSGEYSSLFLYHVYKNIPAFVLKNYNIKPNIYSFYVQFKDTFKLFLLSLKDKFKNQHSNAQLKLKIKSELKFFINIPLIILKRFRIIKSF